MPCSANLACTTCPEDLSSQQHYSNYHSHDEDNTIGMDLATATLSKCFMYKVRHNNNPNVPGNNINDEVPIAGKPGVYMAGTFTGVCYMVEDEKCGLTDGCENTEVTITGTY